MVLNLKLNFKLLLNLGLLSIDCSILNTDVKDPRKEKSGMR